jgi:hypothetical protein
MRTNTVAIYDFSAARQRRSEYWCWIDCDDRGEDPHSRHTHWRSLFLHIKQLPFTISRWQGSVEADGGVELTVTVEMHAVGEFCEELCVETGKKPHFKRASVHFWLCVWQYSPSHNTITNRAIERSTILFDQGSRRGVEVRLLSGDFCFFLSRIPLCFFACSKSIYRVLRCHIC